MKYKIKTKTSLNKASVWCSLRIFNRDTLFQPINQIQLHSILIRFPFTSWSNLLSFTSVKFSCSVVSFLLSVIWWIPHQPHVCTCLDIRSSSFRGLALVVQDQYSWAHVLSTHRTSNLCSEGIGGLEQHAMGLVCIRMECLRGSSNKGGDFEEEGKVGVSMAELHDGEPCSWGKAYTWVVE